MPLVITSCGENMPSRDTAGMVMPSVRSGGVPEMGNQPVKQVAAWLRNRSAWTHIHFWLSGIPAGKPVMGGRAPGVTCQSPVSVGKFLLFFWQYHSVDCT